MLHCSTGMTNQHDWNTNLTFSRFYQSSLSSGFSTRSFCIPSAVNLRILPTDGSNSSSESKCRAYFVSYPMTNQKSELKPTLFSCDIDGQIPDVELNWNRMLPEEFDNEQHTPSLADILLRQRMRASSSGITDYDVSPMGQLVIVASSHLYSVRDTNSFGTPTLLDPVIEAPLQSAIQPVLCPSNDNLLACFSDCNIILGQPMTNTWTPLTHYVPDSGLFAGMSSFVVQEEFDRYLGFWWGPIHPITRQYQILYEEVDEREVELVHIMAESQFESHRYPKPGARNASSDLKIGRFSLDPNGQISNIVHYKLRKPLLQYIPGYEYLLRAGWTPDGNFIWCQLITRTQHQMVLILIPIDNFIAISSDKSGPENSVGTCSPCVQLVLESEPRFWVKAHSFLQFLTQSWHPVTIAPSPNSSQTNQITFIWASHRSGYTHLYLMQRSWPHSDVVHELNGPNEANPALVLTADDVFTSQLTHGTWEVTGTEIFVDELNQFIYFESTKEHPLLRHIYAVSYAAKDRGQLHCLTPLNQSTNCNLTPDQLADQLATESTEWLNCLDPLFQQASLGLANYPLSYELLALDIISGWAILASSSLDQLTGVEVVKIQMDDQNPRQPMLKHKAWLRCHVPHNQAISNLIRPLLPPKVVQFDVSTLAQPNNHQVMGFGENYATQLQSNPTMLYGLLFLPTTIQTHSQERFPVLHFVYGGPGVQLVKGNHSKHIVTHAQLFCHFGYAVFLCDCRGSTNRGIEFEGYIKNRLGQVELNEHVGFLKHVAISSGLLDLSRVAILGYSYGGYMSLLASMLYSDFYRASAAVSPVVDWLLYDSAYTERYMSLPSENPVGYMKGNVMEYALNLPSDSARLMICHGAQDENVHFGHTTALLGQLLSAGKPIRFQCYPSSRHRIKEQSHLQAAVLEFFESVLKPNRGDGWFG